MAMTILAWLMIAVFMFVVMTKKLSPLTALCAIPLVFAAISLFIPGSPAESWTDLGTWVMDGLGTTANTGILLLFAILYFSIMLDAGLFDPIGAADIFLDNPTPRTPSRPGARRA